MFRVLIYIYLILSISFFAQAQDLLSVNSVIKDSVILTLLTKYEDIDKNNLLKEFIPYYSVISNSIDKEKYIVFNLYNSDFLTVSFPSSVSFSNFVDAFSQKELTSDSSGFVDYSSNKFYVKQEGNYITFVEKNYMANYNSLKTLPTNSIYFDKFYLFLSKLAKSNTSGFFYYPSQTNFQNFQTGFKFIENYNFLSDIDYTEGFFVSNEILGSAYLKSTSKASKLYVPRPSRKLSLNFISPIQDVITISVNPTLFSDLVETFFPDIVSSFPSIRNEIVNTLSGTVGILNYTKGDFTKDNTDIVILLGFKSKSQGQRFLKTFLGLFKYKFLNVKGNRVYEISLGENLAYLFMSDNEFVITLKLGRMEKLIDDLKKATDNGYYFAYSTIYTRFTLSTVSNVLPNGLNYLGLVASNRVQFYADIDDSFRVITYSISVE
ncbi:MAG: hypothetical protein ACP5PT_05060 [Brevinematia bacterium]